MKIEALKCGAILVVPETNEDRRGTCTEVDLQKAETPAIVRELFVTSHAHVLRGLHFQDFNVAPLTKVLRCTEGSIFEALVDMRTGVVETLRLNAELAQVLIIPPWCAHGYLIVTDRASVLYGFDAPRSPEHECVVRWDSAGVDWPDKTPIMSDRDAAAPSLEEVMAAISNTTRSRPEKTG